VLSWAVVPAGARSGAPVLLLAADPEAEAGPSLIGQNRARGNMGGATAAPLSET
jgi:hypothetical protein